MEYWKSDEFATKGFVANKKKKWSVAVTAATNANTAKTNGIPLSTAAGTATEFAG